MECSVVQREEAGTHHFASITQNTLPSSIVAEASSSPMVRFCEPAVGGDAMCCTSFAALSALLILFYAGSFVWSWPACLGSTHEVTINSFFVTPCRIFAASPVSLPLAFHRHLRTSTAASAGPNGRPLP